jgi:acyl carrier protein
MVAKIDWSILKPLHEARRARPLLARLDAAPKATRAAASPSATTPGLFDRIAAAPQAMRMDMLVEFVSREVAAVLGLDASQPVPVDKGLFDMGMDSLMSVELKRRLERGAGQTLPSTLTFNYPNVGALAAFLETRLAAAAETAAPAALQAATPAASVAPTPQPGSDELDALSDEELEARLLASLEQAR